MLRRYLHWAMMLAIGSLWAAAPPPTAKEPVHDTYGTITVTDDYWWLEAFADPQVKQWASAQNAYARAILDALPNRDALSRELRQIFQPAQARYFPIAQRGKLIFAMKRDSAHQHQTVVSLSSVDDLSEERTVLDPDALDAKHLTAIDFAVPSLDGRYLTASLSSGGSESGDLHVYETATGKPLPEVIPRVNMGTAGGDVVWNTDSSGFYYTRYPREGERPAADMNFYQQVYFHKIGDKPENDPYEIGKEFPRIAEIRFTASHDSFYIGLSVAIGDGGDHEYWVLAPGHEWRKLAAASDQVKQIAFGYHKDIYVVSTLNAPRGKVTHIDVAENVDQGTVLVPPSNVVIRSVIPTPDGPLVNELAGGPSEVLFLPGDGTPVKLRIPSVSNVNCRYLEGTGPVCDVSSYLDTGGLFHVDLHSRKLAATALLTPPPIPLEDFVLTRRLAVSKDHTRIPLNIIHCKGIKLDGSHAALLTIRRIRDQPDSAVSRAAGSFAGARRDPCGGQSAGRRRIRRDLARPGQADEPAECI